MNACFTGNVGEGSITIISIQRMLAGPKAARSAYDRDSFPSAIGILAGNTCSFKREADIVRNEQNEMSDAVIVHEGAACAEPYLIATQPGFFSDVSEGSVSVVAVQHVLPVCGEKNIVKAIIVVVSDAHSAGPPQRVQTSFF